MLIQNTSASPTPQPASNSAPVVVAAPHQEVAAPAPPQTAVKLAAEKVAEEPTAAQLRNAVEHINVAMRQNNSNVEFTIDSDSKRTVIKVVESKTGDVIRQYPTEEVIAIAHAIDKMQQRGLMLKQEA